MFFKQSGFTWLVVGLGNPGARYESTRHNMGFLAVDRLAEREKLRFNKLRFKAWTAEWKLGESKVLVMKPQTYMNLSGVPVGAAARFYKIPPEHILVVSDDIDLPVGKLRLRAFGSAGGHNGLKNIDSQIGQNYNRIRIGVGSPQEHHTDTVNFVLSRFSKAEMTLLQERIDFIASTINELIKKGITHYSNIIGMHNSK